MDDCEAGKLSKPLSASYALIMNRRSFDAVYTPRRRSSGTPEDIALEPILFLIHRDRSGGMFLFADCDILGIILLGHDVPI